MSALRIYDADIKRQPELIELAQELVAGYLGNWDAITALIGVPIADIKTARQVLNMFLSSTEQFTEHARIVASLSRREREEMLVGPPASRQPRLHVVRERPRRIILDVPARIKRKYGRSNVKSAVCHIIEHDHTKMRWSDASVWDHRGSTQRPPRWVPTMWVKWKCGVSMHVQMRKGKQSGVFMDEADRKVCAKCMLIEAEEQL